MPFSCACTSQVFASMPQCLALLPPACTQTLARQRPLCPSSPSGRPPTLQRPGMVAAQAPPAPMPGSSAAAAGAAAARAIGTGTGTTLTRTTMPTAITSLTLIGDTMESRDMGRGHTMGKGVTTHTHTITTTIGRGAGTKGGLEGRAAAGAASGGGMTNHSAGDD